jgi:hypothetical protein
MYLGIYEINVPGKVCSAGFGSASAAFIKNPETKFCLRMDLCGFSIQFCAHYFNSYKIFVALNPRIMSPRNGIRLTCFFCLLYSIVQSNR